MLNSGGALKCLKKKKKTCTHTQKSFSCELLQYMIMYAEIITYMVLLP